MTELKFTKDIHAPVQAVFDLIADLPNYGRWLPPSNLYAAVTEYSGLPVQAGTTYLDKNNVSPMTGTVTLFEPPHRITFRQVTKSLFGSLTIEIRYLLEPHGDTTLLTREVTVSPSGLYRLVEPFLVRPIPPEVGRILEMMKAYLEKQAKI